MLLAIFKSSSLILVQQGGHKRIESVGFFVVAYRELRLFLLRLSSREMRVLLQHLSDRRVQVHVVGEVILRQNHRFVITVRLDSNLNGCKFRFQLLILGGQGLALLLQLLKLFGLLLGLRLLRLLPFPEPLHPLLCVVEILNAQLLQQLFLGLFNLPSNEVVYVVLSKGLASRLLGLLLLSLLFGGLLSRILFGCLVSHLLHFLRHAKYLPLWVNFRFIECPLRINGPSINLLLAIPPGQAVFFGKLPQSCLPLPHPLSGPLCAFSVTQLREKPMLHLCGSHPPFVATLRLLELIGPGVLLRRIGFIGPARDARKIWILDMSAVDAE